MELINKIVNEISNDELGCPSYEMATIGSFMQKVGDSQNKTGFKVYVTNDNRPLSHIHIIRRDRIKKKVCVEFSNPPKYFRHDKYKDTFTPEEAEEFNKFLSLPYKYAQTFRIGKEKYRVKTYWQYCIYQWKLENDGMTDNLHLETDDKGFIIFPEQPDYTKLNDYTTVETTGLTDALRKAAEELSGELGEEVDFEQTVYRAEACEKRNLEREKWLPVFSEQKKELLRLAAEFNPFDFSYTENLIFQAVKINYEYFKRPNLVEFDTSDTKYDKMIESFEKLLVYIKIIESEDSENATAARKKFYACLADNIETWWD